MCKSCHLVSVALSVMKNVGLPICVIISVSSPFCLFQNEHVPLRHALNCMIWSGSMELGVFWMC